MQELQGLEQLPTELRQQVYFYVGFPVRRKLYKASKINYINGIAVRPQLSALARWHYVTCQRRVYLDYILQATCTDGIRPNDSLHRRRWYNHLQEHPLLRVNRQFRHEILSLLFDDGLELHVKQLWAMETPSSWTGLIRSTNMLYISSAVVLIDFPDTETLFGAYFSEEGVRNTFSFLAACAPNLRELTVKSRVHFVDPKDERELAFFLEEAVSLHRLMKSLHHMTSTTSESQLQLVRLQWSDSISQVIHKKDFDKVCTWGSEIILQLHSLKGGDISELQEVDIDSLSGHTYSDGNCDDRYLTWDFRGLEGTFFSDLD